MTAGTGRVWRQARVRPHRATTAALQAAFPFLAESGMGPRGTYIGRDVFGGSFCFDPFELYAAGLLTNPNMVIAGAVGSGKSSLVKTFLWRQQEFGRAAWVADPKGEYADLAAACDAPVIRLGPGQAARLNPFDAPGSGSPNDGADPTGWPTGGCGWCSRSPAVPSADRCARWSTPPAASPSPRSALPTPPRRSCPPSSMRCSSPPRTPRPPCG
jgi:hypothetical protein